MHASHCSDPQSLELLPAGSSTQGGKAALVSHYAAALQTLLAQSQPQPNAQALFSQPKTPLSPQFSSSSRCSSLVCDLGSNPHLTPRYTQGIAAYSHSADSASSHSLDNHKSAESVSSPPFFSFASSSNAAVSHSHAWQQRCCSSSHELKSFSRSACSSAVPAEAESGYTVQAARHARQSSRVQEPDRMSRSCDTKESGHRQPVLAKGHGGQPNSRRSHQLQTVASGDLSTCCNRHFCVHKIQCLSVTMQSCIRSVHLLYTYVNAISCISGNIIMFGHGHFTSLH